MLGHRYKCKLSEVNKEKARRELNEPLDNEERLKQIDKFLSFYHQKYPKLKEEEQKDKFLLRFLRARKFNCEGAAKMMCNYVNRHATAKEVFDIVGKPAELRQFHDSKCITVLRGRARNMAAIVLLKPTKCRTDITEFIAVVFLALEKLLENEENQVHGIILIEDLNYVNFKIASQVTPKFGKKITELIQDTMPMRLKCICVVNESWLFNIVYSVVRPFLKDKLRKRITIVGKEYGKLHELITQQELPECYGGKMKDSELNQKKWSDILMGVGRRL